MEDRFFIGPLAIPHIDIASIKAVELLMEQEIPPPFYLAIDCVEDSLVIACMPSYDYQKFLESESFSEMIESAKNQVEELKDITDEEVAEMGFWLLPSAAFAAGFNMESGKTSVMNGNIDSSRIYASATKISDIDVLRLISKTGIN